MGQGTERDDSKILNLYQRWKNVREIWNETERSGVMRKKVRYRVASLFRIARTVSWWPESDDIAQHCLSPPMCGFFPFLLKVKNRFPWLYGKDFCGLPCHQLVIETIFTPWQKGGSTSLRKCNCWSSWYQYTSLHVVISQETGMRSTWISCSLVSQWGKLLHFHDHLIQWAWCHRIISPRNSLRIM